MTAATDWGTRLSDESSPFKIGSPDSNGLIHLGYLIQNNQTHPFALTLQDLTNLLVIGSRTEDIYYNLLIQLCDDYQIPVLILKGQSLSNFEDQVCETSFWHIDLSAVAITFNIMDLETGHHPLKQIAILISLLEEFASLSAAARDLFHIIFWQTCLSFSSPTIQYLQKALSYYQHHNSACKEIQQLLKTLPHEMLNASYDNLRLSRISHLPTIITGNDSLQTRFSMNLLLLKLLAHAGEKLPPLFLVDIPSLNPQILRWLIARYKTANRPLVIFDTLEHISVRPPLRFFNSIITYPSSSMLSPIRQQLTLDEVHLICQNKDQIVVQLQSEPTARIVTIF